MRHQALWVLIGCLTGCTSLAVPFTEAGPARMLAVGAPNVPPLGFAVSASSVRNASFAASHLTDGNLQSAWAPAATDTAPMLTLNLNQRARVTELAIKLDAGATFDVDARDDGGWQPLMANVAPAYRRLSTVALPATTARQLRLDLHATGPATLRVCELQLFGSAVADAAAPQPGLGFVGAGPVLVDPARDAGVDLTLSAVSTPSGASGTLQVTDWATEVERVYRVTGIDESGSAWRFEALGPGGACTLTAHQAGDGVAVLDALRTPNAAWTPVNTWTLQESVSP